MEAWQVGDITVHRVVDVLQDIDLAMLIPEATPDALAPHADWLKPHFQNDNDTVPLSIHAFVIFAGDCKIIVDTCIGNDKPRAMPNWNLRQGTFLDDLAAIGAPREQIDVVLCTHLHVDHVGWNTMLVDGQWVPTFPNARYLIGQEEWNFWKDEEDPFGKEAKIDSIQPIIDSDQVTLVETNHQVSTGVQLVPTPGHTPGHVSVLLESRGDRAIITGDLFHHPVQFAQPGWKDIADVESDVAESTRKAFMASYQHDVMVLGTHFASPTAGYITDSNTGYWFRAHKED